MLKEKRAIISVSLFSLLVIILVSIFTLSYFFYDLKLNEFEDEIQKINNLNEVLSFRDILVQAVANENQTIIYKNKLSQNAMELNYNLTTLQAKLFYEGDLVENSIQSLGIKSCGEYTIFPTISNNVTFNGSCIIVS